MNIKSYILLLVCITVSMSSFAQQQLTTGDLIIKKIESLDEYKSEMKKVPALSKANGRQARIAVEVDTTGTSHNPALNDKNRKDIAIVHILEDLGKLSVLAYEVIIDKKSLKIISINNELDGVDVSVN